MGGRNVRQCRERWKHYLSSERAKSPWSNEEDLLLFQKVMELGPKWTKIARCFNDRTDIQIKTRWTKRFGNCGSLFVTQKIIPNVPFQNHNISTQKFEKDLTNKGQNDDKNGQCEKEVTGIVSVEPICDLDVSENFEQIHRDNPFETLENNQLEDMGILPSDSADLFLFPEY
ncbi:hypothetical protein TRFO_40622 [Tritrichomonas foetus]|uniref:Myb-like DNA-binding domain containing protein n=1 Tax=Tritrichomonas foetus TaxID=1144522 RepID=A0A1J4J102_9EUKA|nr:hypothetical protein TRFO_40622 [Tritrichomonas foetus]|eukprot:OHS93090.1 hypothetical protein TRFO_40622 [Tritrichomonas foetus]